MEKLLCKKAGQHSKPAAASAAAGLFKGVLFGY